MARLPYIRLQRLLDNGPLAVGLFKDLQTMMHREDLFIFICVQRGSTNKDGVFFIEPLRCSYHIMVMSPLIRTPNFYPSSGGGGVLNCSSAIFPLFSDVFTRVSPAFLFIFSIFGFLAIQGLFS